MNVAHLQYFKGAWILGYFRTVDWRFVCKNSLDCFFVREPLIFVWGTETVLPTAQFRVKPALYDGSFNYIDEAKKSNTISFELSYQVAYEDENIINNWVNWELRETHIN